MLRQAKWSSVAGLSVKIPPCNLDLAYVRNTARVGELFGTESNSILATLTLDYDAILRRH